MKILIADDHTLVREGLKQLFALSREVDVVAEAVDGGQVLDAVRAGGLDLVLLDMTMPGINGADLISRIRVQDGAPPILVLSMHNEAQIARRALTAGAAGYLTKDSHPHILLAAMHKVTLGGRFIDPVLAEKMVFEGSGNTQRPPHEQLSERELHILRLLARGLSVNEVAAELAISNKTVSTHKARLMQKMGFQNNSEIVRYAVEFNLIE